MTRRKLGRLCYCWRLPKTWPSWRKGGRCFCGAKEGHTTLEMPRLEAEEHLILEIQLFRQSTRIRRNWMIAWSVSLSIGAIAGGLGGWLL